MLTLVAKAPPIAKARSACIVSPLYDGLFFVYSPLIALALGAFVSWTPLAVERFTLDGKQESFISLFSGVLTMAHLVIVFFRSYGNPAVFRQYQKRFVWAPVLLFSSMMVSSWMLVFVFVLAVWWDVYHSALQTFGLGRMYDARADALNDESRRLDRGLNLVLYIGPILGGAVLMDHVRHFDKFKDVGSAFFCAVPVFAQAHHRWLTYAVLAFSGAYLAYYTLGYRRLIRAGKNVSPQKAWLFAATGLCSLYAWGFNSFGQAFFIMNFFHSVQYFALIWHAEKKRIRFLPVLLVSSLVYGLWAQFLGESSHTAMSILLTVTILHFWYDGFIWSVSRPSG